MDFHPKTRQQKLLEALYPFFGDIAAEAVQDSYALRVCRHVQALKENAIRSQVIRPFVELWDRDYPEENPLDNDDLLWALSMLEEHLSTQIKKIELAFIYSTSTRAKLQVINGGLSDNPDRPYVDKERLVHEYDF